MARPRAARRTAGTEVRLVGGGAPGPGTGVPASADAEGLQAAFEAYGGELLGLARRALGDRPSAEEAVQETFARAWRARRRFDPRRGTLRGWLFAIERNVVVDLARARAARPVTVVRDVDDVHPAAPDRTEELLEGWQLSDAVGRLGPEHRRVVVEICLEGRSGPEVAARLGIPEGTVRSRLHYALRALRTELEESGWRA